MIYELVRAADLFRYLVYKFGVDDVKEFFSCPESSWCGSNGEPLLVTNKEVSGVVWFIGLVISVQEGVGVRFRWGLAKLWGI